MIDSELYSRLLAKTRVDPGRDCWLWTGSNHADRKYPASRYGYIYIKAYGRCLNAHRAMWFAYYGPLTPDQFVCHKCDVPLCINPQHLFVGSHKDNMADSRRKGRHFLSAKTHCKRGHALSGENVYVHRGLRNCKQCQRARLRIRKGGWPDDLAFNTPPVALGYSVVKNATWPKKLRAPERQGK